MFCQKCGNELGQGARFCTACGAENTSQKEPVLAARGTTSLKCKACGGIMDVKDGQNILSCSYCGSKELLSESDKVSVARIRGSTAKDLVFGVMDRVENTRSKKMEEQRAKDEKARKDSKKALIIIVLLLILSFVFIGIMAHRENKEKAGNDSSSIESVRVSGFAENSQ